MSKMRFIRICALAAPAIVGLSAAAPAHAFTYGTAYMTSWSGFHVSALRRDAGEAALLDDKAATICFDTVREAFGRGAAEDLAFGIYDLEDVGDTNDRLKNRAAELGLGAAAQFPSTAGGYLAVAEGDLELRVNTDSGSELFVNRARFHKGEDAKSLLSEKEYVSRAFDHVASAVPSARAQQPTPTSSAGT